MNQREDYTDELVSAYFDGELTGDELARIEQLLTRGERESQWLEQIESLRQDLLLLPAPGLNREFTLRTIEAARLARAEAPRPSAPDALPVPASDSSQHRWYGWVTAAVGLAAVLLLAAFLVNRPSDSPAGPSMADQKLPPKESRASSIPAREGAQPDRASPKLAKSGETATDGNRVADATDTGAVAVGPDAGQPPTEHPIRSAMAGHRPDTSPSADAPQLAGHDPGRTGAAGSDVRMGAPTLDPSKPLKTLPRQPDDSGQLLMVIDVTLTPLGKRQGRFDQALLDHNVPFDATLVVQEELEAALMRSRFIKPAEVAPPVPNDDVQLVYVVTRGGKVDEIWRAMSMDRENFAHIGLDLALLPADQDVFRKLRRAADEEWAARDVEQRNLAGAPRAGDRIRAQRLELPASWKGVPASRLGRVSLVPDWMRDQLAAQALLPRPVDGSAGGRQVQGERLGESIVAEALFVITTSPADD